MKLFFENEMNEALNESYARVSYFDHNGDFQGIIIHGDTPKSIINKIKKIDDSFGVYSIDRASKDIAYSHELKALGIDVHSIDL